MRKVSWFDLILVAMGRRLRYRVEGNSMLPVLKDGEIVMVKPSQKFEVGDIVLAQHPYKQGTKIIKRISAISDAGKFTLTGDNPQESTDSRVFGEIDASEIIGKVVSRKG